MVGQSMILSKHAPASHAFFAARILSRAPVCLGFTYTARGGQDEPIRLHGSLQFIRWKQS